MLDWFSANSTYVVWAAVVGVGYLLGAIPSGFLMGRWVAGVDLRKLGSGNIGATNALRVLGRWPSLVVLLVDTGKAAVAVTLARLLGTPDYICAASAVAVVAGHCWSAYIGFRGGKGVACALGAVLAFFWPAGVIGAALAAPVMWLTRYVSVGSLAGTIGGTLVILGAVALGFLPLGSALFVFVAAFVIYRHRENLQRLREGTERKLGQSVQSVKIKPSTFTSTSR
jgi:acyl phosphate:glycerol-3-phosphate acyltransferase